MPTAISATEPLRMNFLTSSDILRLVIISFYKIMRLLKLNISEGDETVPSTG